MCVYVAIRMAWILNVITTFCNGIVRISFTYAFGLCGLDVAGLMGQDQL